MANETAEQAILNKLAQAPSFHPAGAKLFVPDWTLDPGDVVTVTAKDNVNDPDETPTSYNVPIYSMNLTWNGASKVEIESTGNQQREPLSALRRKEYQTGRRGYGRQQELENEFKEFETWQEQTDETIGTYAAQFVDILGDGTNEGRLTIAETAIEQTASDATITAQAAGILLDSDGHPILDERGKYQYDPNAADTTLTARINTNVTAITQEVTRAQGEETTLSGLISTEAGKISQIVTAVGNNGEVTAGSIILAINKTKDGSATSTTIITSDAINLEGYVTASYVDTAVLLADSLTSDTGYIGNIKASNINTGGNVTASGAVIGSGLYIGTEAPYTDVSTAVAAIRKKTTGLADGEIGFEYHTLGSSTWTPVNFNIADTQYYNDGVSAAGYAGKNSVGLNPLSYTEIQGTNYPSYQTIFTDTTGRTDTSGNTDNLHRNITLSLDADSNYVYMKHGSDIIARITNPGGGTITVNDWSLTHQTGTDYTYKASAKVNGTLYESGNLDATEAYNNGWTGAYESVGIFPTAVADLVPGGSPITIYAQAKATSGSAKSNVASVQVKARALNLKNETFSANDTYTVPEGYDGYGTVTVNVHDGGGGGDYYATFIDNITLESTDIGNSVTKYSIANYSDGHRDPAANTRVVIDASAVYSAGVEYGAGGTIGITNDEWNYGRSTFRATVNGTTVGSGMTIDIDPEYTLPGMLAATSTGYFTLVDSESNKLIYPRSNFPLYLQERNGYVYLKSQPYYYNPSNSNVLAKISISGGGSGGEQYAVTSIDKIKLTSADIYTSVYYPKLHYNDPAHTVDETVSMEIDASDVYRKGQEDGANISILEEYKTTIDSNNTTVTLLPSDKGNYNVMASARVKVDVPPVYRIAQNLTQTIVLPASHKGTAAITNNQVEYDIGPDTGNFSVVIDASNVWQAGFDEGAGAEFTPTTVTVQGLGPYTVTPILSNSGVSFNRYGYDKLYYYDDDLERYVECTSRARYWFYTTSDATGGSYYRAGNDITYYKQGYTAQYYVRTE